MTCITSISHDGVLQIPRHILDSLGLKPGDRLLLVPREDRLWLIKADPGDE